MCALKQHTVPASQKHTTSRAYSSLEGPYLSSTGRQGETGRQLGNSCLLNYNNQCNL